MGCTQVVGVPLTAFEREASIDQIVKFFIENNDISITESIFIDKDLVEHRVLSRHFPKAGIFYCKEDKRNIKSKVKNKAICEKIYSLCETTNNDEAELILAHLASDLKKTNPTTRKYVEENWLSCKEMWVKAYRYGVTTLCQDTSNRVESCNAKLKIFVKKKAKMSDCLTGLFEFLADVRKTVSYKHYQLNLF